MNRCGQDTRAELAVPAGARSDFSNQGKFTEVHKPLAVRALACESDGASALLICRLAESRLPPPAHLALPKKANLSSHDQSGTKKQAAALPISASRDGPPAFNLSALPAALCRRVSIARTDTGTPASTSSSFGRRRSTCPSSTSARSSSYGATSATGSSGPMTTRTAGC